MTITIEKIWDGNIGTIETPDGRLIDRPNGWRFLVVVDDQADRDFETEDEADAYAVSLLDDAEAGRDWDAFADLR